jgi:hypothetical protein
MEVKRTVGDVVTFFEAAKALMTSLLPGYSHPPAILRYFDTLPQAWELVLDDVPDYLVIHRVVAVDDVVSHAHDLPQFGEMLT